MKNLEPIDRVALVVMGLLLISLAFLGCSPVNHTRTQMSPECMCPAVPASKRKQRKPYSELVFRKELQDRSVDQ